MARARDIPPGVHLQARYAPPGLPPRQLRILGDDERGYLIGGLTGLSGEDDFWFRTLEEAFVRTDRLGIRRDDWTAITQVDQAEML